MRRESIRRLLDCAHPVAIKVRGLSSSRRQIDQVQQKPNHFYNRKSARRERSPRPGQRLLHSATVRYRANNDPRDAFQSLRGTQKRRQGPPPPASKSCPRLESQETICLDQPRPPSVFMRQNCAGPSDCGPCITTGYNYCGKLSGRLSFNQFSILIMARCGVINFSLRQSSLVRVGSTQSQTNKLSGVSRSCAGRFNRLIKSSRTKNIFPV